MKNYWPIFCKNSNENNHPLTHRLAINMGRSEYIIALGKTDSENMTTLLLSRSKYTFFLIAALILLMSVICTLAWGLHRVTTNQKLTILERENNELRGSYASLVERTQITESNLAILQDKNRQIRIAAALPVPELDFGVGGPVSFNRADMLGSHEMRIAEFNLEKLEYEIEWLSKNTQELENSISNRMMQISHYPSIRPVRGGWISSGFGKRTDPFTGLAENHPGLDIAIKPGSEVCASAAGIVKRINNRVTTNKGYGKYVLIDHGYGYESLYGHLSKIYVRKGQKIKRWDIVGLTGNTGKSTAPHLHYAVFTDGAAKDPLDFILE